jgi:hypothetical protein
LHSESRDLATPACNIIGAFGCARMSPTDKIRLPFRWDFFPIEDASDRSIRWRWRAYTYAGGVAMESHTAFDTLTECIDDAKENGYGEQ